MKYLFVLAVGTGLGFFLAHKVNQTPEGREFFTGLDSRLARFRSSVVDGYRSREAELHERA